MYWRIERCRRRLREQLARPHPHPVLVFGNQKSGTSAIAAALASISGTSVTLDLEREYQEPSYHKVVSGEMSIRDFARRNRLGFSRTIVKEPNFLTLWKPLLELYPDAPRILVVRDPRDNVRSVLDRLGLAGDREQLTEEEVAANGPGWELYLDGGWLGISSQHYVEVMAHRWNLGYEFWKENQERTSFIRYEDFLQDKEATMVWLAQAVGLPVRNQLGEAANYQYQPRGSGRTDWQAVFGTRNLKRIERICSRGMKDLGYEVTC